MMILTMGTIKCRQENIKKSLPILNQFEAIDKIVVVPQEPQYSVEDIEALRKYCKDLTKVEILRAEHPDIKSLNKLIPAVTKYGENDYITLDDDITVWTNGFKDDFNRFLGLIAEYPECVIPIDSHKAFIIKDKHTGELSFFQDTTNDIQKVCQEISCSASVSWLCYYPHTMFKDNKDLLDYEKIKHSFTIDTSKLLYERPNQFDGSIQFVTHDEMWFAAIAALKGIKTFNSKFYGRRSGYYAHRVEVEHDESLGMVIGNRSLVVEINKHINQEFPELGKIAASTEIDLYCNESDIYNVNTVILNSKYKDSRKINIYCE